MAKRKEIEVGQVRELKDPSSGRYARLDVAKVEVLAVDQAAETYAAGSGGGGGSYNLHDDMVLVQVLDANGWRFDMGSSRQDDKRPLVGQRPDGHRPYWSRDWKYEDLPEGQYLVKPALLGAIWDQEAKDEARRRGDEAKAKRERYQQAVAEQRNRIKAVADEAGITDRYGSRFDAGEHAQFSWNELADLILLASSGPSQIDVGRVEWSDFE